MIRWSEMRSQHNVAQHFEPGVKGENSRESCRRTACAHEQPTSSSHRHSPTKTFKGNNTSAPTIKQTLTSELFGGTDMLLYT